MDKKNKAKEIAKKIISFVKSHKKLFEKLGFFTIAIIIYCLLCNPTIEQFLSSFLGETITESLPIASIGIFIGGDSL